MFYQREQYFTLLLDYFSENVQKMLKIFSVRGNGNSFTADLVVLGLLKD